MRVVVHDYAGHPFQMQLSRELARRGHTVAHWHCSSVPTGKGQVTRRHDDPASLSIAGIAMPSTFQRYSPSKRLRQEVMYGRALGRRLVALDPDVALFCNTPLVAHVVAARACARRGIPMAFWQQDIISLAIAAAAEERLGIAGWPIGAVASRMERALARNSKAIIAISDEFVSVLARWGVRRRTSVIHNWAPLPEIPVRPRDNEWATEHNLVGKMVVLYSGTLGIKHNPAVLASVSRSMQTEFPEGRLVVISEGLGRDWLQERKAKEGLDNLVLLDYQPYESFPDVLGSADVLVAILEPTAGRYSVPSKVLSYLCAHRPIVAVIPTDNAAAVVLRSSGGGVIVPPGKNAAAVEAVMDLLRDDARRSQLAAAGRRYSEATFDISNIANNFEAILSTCIRSGRAGRSVRAAAETSACASHGIQQ